MLQRIQSVYLAAVVVLALLTMILPVVEFVNVTTNISYLMDVKGVHYLQQNQTVTESSTWGLTVLSGLIAAFAGYAIFLYKNRVKQIRFCVINFLFIVGYYVALVVYIMLISSRLDADWHLKIVCAFPLISVILNYLAIGAIGKDENLVKSTDRIR